MAWYFDGSDHVTLANNAALDIPNGDWTFCGWFRVSGNSGTNFPRVFCWGTAGGTPHVQVFVAQADTGAANADTLGARFIGPGGADTGVIYTSGMALNSHTNKWIAWCLTHDDANNTTYLRMLDRATGTYYSASKVLAIGAITTSDITAPLYVGASSTLGTSRWVGDLAEMAFLPGVFFDDSNWHGYIHGGRPHRYPSCSWYVPMIGGRFEEWKNQLTVSNTGVAQGTGHPQMQLITPRHYNIPTTWSSPGGLRVSRQAVDVLGQKNSNLRVVTQALDVMGTTDPDIRVHRIAVEYLRELVVLEEGASSQINLTQGADSNIKNLSASSVLSLQQTSKTNFLTLSVTSPIALSQSETVDYLEIPKGSGGLVLNQQASATLWPGKHAESPLALTQDASYSRVRNISASNAIWLGDLGRFVGPKWVEAISPIPLAQDVYLPFTYEVSARSRIGLSQATSQGGSKRLVAQSPIVLDVLADNRVKVRKASSQIVLTQSTSFEYVLTAESHIELAQEVILGAVNKCATSQLNLTQVARSQPLPQSAASQIQLDQTVRQNIRNQSVVSEITLSHSNTVLKPIRAEGTSELSEQDYVVDPTTGDVTLEDVGLRHVATVTHRGVTSASHILSFNQVVGLTHVRADGTSVSASSLITFVQTASRSTTGLGFTQMNLSHVAQGWAGKPGDSQLQLSDSATVNIVKTFLGQSAVEVKQAAAYTRIVGSTLGQYTPFVGESSDPNAPTPPPTTLDGPLSGLQVPFQLVYPATGVVTDSLTLRAPNLGNLDRLAFNRVLRETRGGTLVVYADPIWPKIQTLVLSFSGLTSTQARNLLAFIENHLGQEIGLIDWEHRFWRGVITTPDEPIVQDSRCSFTASFEFQGERDPTWTP